MFSRRRRAKSSSLMSFNCSPSVSATPAVGRKSPATIANNVVFPDPDGPTSAVRSPRRNSKSSPESTRVAASPDPYAKDTRASRAAKGKDGVEFASDMNFTLTAIIALFLAAAATFARADESRPPDSAPLVAAFGDSLSSGYGLANPARDGFAPALQRALMTLGIRAEVQNHGVAGDTSDDGLNRLDWMLHEKPDIVVVEFGANDMFRLFPPDHTRANLDAILRKIRDAGAVPILAGMLAPLNSGKEFANAFNGIFPSLAKKHEIELYPFFLKGVALRPDLNLPDGLHPNAAGTEVIAANIAPIVARAIEQWRAAQQ